MLTELKAQARGVVDGLVEPYDLSSGLTWSYNQGTNEAYDRGVNIGQALARTWARARDTLHVVRIGGRVEPAEAP